MSGNYTLNTKQLTSRPRSKRLRELGASVINNYGGSSYTTGNYLPRVEFDDMFEWVTQSNGVRVIKAKATVVSVGNLVALYKGNDVPSSSVGLDLAALESYLTTNNYATQSWVLQQGFITALTGYATESWVQSQGYLTSHQSLANYVTLDTPQTIAGQKTFTQEIHAVADGGVFSDPAYGIACGFKTPNPIAAGSFIKSGGTSSQFLKADGSVDENKYIPYSTASLATVNGTNNNPQLFNIENETLIANYGEYWSVINIGSYSGSGFRSQIAFPYVNGLGDTDMFIRTAWGVSWRDWRRVLHSGNYASILDSAYVKKSGDTMTGDLVINANSVFPIKLNSTKSDGNSVCGFYLNNAEKGYVGYISSLDWGVILRNSIAGKVLGIKDDGTPHFNGNTLWHSGNDGSGSGLDADLLDGFHGSDYLRSFWTNYPGFDCASFNNSSLVSFTYGNNAPFGGGFIDVSATQYGFYLGTSYLSDGPLYYRRHGNSEDGGMGAWQQLARVTDNVASATKLATTRNIWGQNFNGEGNVDGTLWVNAGSYVANRATIVLNANANGAADIIFKAGSSTVGNFGRWAISSRHEDGRFSIWRGIENPTVSTEAELFSILANGNVGIGTASPAYKLDVNGDIQANGWLRTKGSAGWYNQTYQGGWWMKDSTYIRNYNNKRLLIEGINDYYAVWLSSGGFCCEGYVGAAWNNGYAALNVGIQNNTAQTPLLLAYRYQGGQSGAARLFAMELLNNGNQLNIGFAGAQKFTMYSDGTLLANGNLTALSDRRAKSFITDLEWRGRLQPKRYWKDGRWQIGFIAQEVEPFYPETVFKGRNPEDMWALDYNGLLAAMALQTNNNTDDIEKLKARVERLEAENKQLKQLLRA